MEGRWKYITMSYGVLGVRADGCSYCTNRHLVINVEFKKWNIRYRDFENVNLNDYRRGPLLSVIFIIAVWLVK